MFQSHSCIATLIVAGLVVVATTNACSGGSPSSAGDGSSGTSGSGGPNGMSPDGGAADAAGTAGGGCTEFRIGATVDRKVSPRPVVT
jgi:hypothetical protein